jgi:hypothetical protein
MTQTAGETQVLTYATTAPGALTRRGWQSLFWVGLIHLLAALVAVGFASRGVFVLLEFLRDVPVYNWFAIGLLVHSATVPVMVLVNILAVFGYATGLGGRSPRKWFLIYVPTQLAIILLQDTILIVLASNSPYQVKPGASIGTHWIAVALMPVMHAVFMLPLFLLLFPKIRRACFAR